MTFNELMSLAVLVGSAFLAGVVLMVFVEYRNHKERDDE